VVRRLVGRGNASLPRTLTLQGSASGLRIRIHGLEIPAEYCDEGSYPTESVSLPFTALADCEGRDDSLVTLEPTNPNKVEVHWSDAGVPRLQTYDLVDPKKLPAFPEAAHNLITQDQSFLKALEQATATAGSDAMRYAVNKIQLHPNGEIYSTDGRQLLIQSGPSLPITKPILIPASNVFACREFPKDAEVKIGMAAEHLTLCVGSWTFHLPIDTNSRYPAVTEIVPKLREDSACCKLHDEDAAFLLRALPRLPVDAEGDQAITVDLNGHVAIRGRAKAEDHPTELLLSNSRPTGTPVRFRTNREYLLRALQMGFTQFHVPKEDAPALAQADGRKYVWMLLGKAGAIAPDENALRISSEPNADAISPTPVEQPEPKRRHSMATISTDGPAQGATSAAEDKALGSPIEEAQALQNVLRDALQRTSRLVSAIRRQRKQSRLLHTTLASLRELQRVEA